MHPSGTGTRTVVDDDIFGFLLQANHEAACDIVSAQGRVKTRKRHSHSQSDDQITIGSGSCEVLNF